MKAAIVEQPGKLAVRALPEPPLGDYEARCALLYGALCAGTDTHLLHGDPPFCHWIKMPFILGHESVGEVVEVGAKVRHLKPGDRVLRVGAPAVGGVNAAWGGFAETGIATDWRALQEDGLDGWADKTVQQILPPDIDPAAGTLFITWRETLSYTMRMGIRAGAAVLVVGSGGNGLAFAAHARNLGAAAVTLVGSGGRADAARRTACRAFVDYRAATCWDQVREAAPGGYDTVIDALGRAATAAAAQRALKPGGMIGVYGLDECGAIHLAPDRTFTCYAGGYDEAEAHDRVLAFYRAGKLDPSVWFNRDAPYTLDTLGEAFEAVRLRRCVKPLVILKRRGCE